MRYFKLIPYILCGFILLTSSCGKWLGNSSTEAMENDTTLSLVVREWSKRIRQYPKNDDYRYQRGMELAKAKKYKLAMTDIDKAIQLNGKNEKYHIARAEIFMGQNETKDALEAYEKAVEVNPKSEDALMNLGRFYLFVRQFDKSENTLKKLVSINPSNVEGHFYEGMLFKEKGDTANAITAFDAAIQVDPYYYNALMQLGQLYSEQRNEVGLSYFRNATLVDEFSDEAWYGMGLLHQRLGQLDTAIVKYQKTIDINPAHYYAYYNTGYILFGQNNWDRAIEHFRIAVKFAPDFAKAHYMLGLCNEGKENKSEAKIHYERCLQVDPNFELAKQALLRVN